MDPGFTGQQIFGADAALYIDIQDYGTTSSQEQSSGSSAGLVGMLVEAAINQIANTISDKSYDIAGMTSSRLLSAGTANGILYGPRSPNYTKQ